MRLTRRRFLFGGAVVLATAAGWAGRRLTIAASRRLIVTRVDAVPEAGPGNALDFFVTGDSGARSQARRRVVSAMSRASERIPPRFIVLTGDNVYPDGVTSAHDDGWKVNFEDAFDAPGLAVPFYPCLGNHDHEGNAAAQIEYSRLQERWRLPAPYHSFSHVVTGEHEAEFFVLDTTPLVEDGGTPFQPEQAAWFEEELKRSTASWKVAIGHHPLHSGGPKGGSSTLRWQLSPIFARYELDLFLSGHNHDLELLDPRRGWLQVVSGAGSAPEEVSPFEKTLFSADGEGFVWVSLRADAAWIQFLKPEEGPVATYRVERSAGGYPRLRFPDFGRLRDGGPGSRSG